MSMRATRRTLIQSLTALLCGVAGIGAAQAASSFEVRLRNLQILVTDLDANDGASAGFDVVQNGMTHAGILGPLGEPGSTYFPYSESSPIAPTHLTASYQGATAQASVGQGLFPDITIRIDDPTVQPFYFELELNAGYELSVRPGTLLNVSAEWTGITTGAPGVATNYLLGTFNVTHIGGTLDRGNTFDEGRLVSQTTTPVELHRLAAFSFSTGADPATFRISSFMNMARLPLSPAPIPEPQSYALMLVGLAALGAVVRRRRASARSHDADSVCGRSPGSTSLKPGP